MLPLSLSAGVLTLARDQGLRSVRLTRAGRTTSVPIDAPPARTQCGWSAVPLVRSRQGRPGSTFWIADTRVAVPAPSFIA